MSDERVLSTSLETIVADQRHLSVLRDAVERLHRITVDATELIALHTTRCLDEGLELPPVTDVAWVRSAMFAVSIASRSGTKTAFNDAALVESKERFMQHLELTSRERLQQMIQFQATAIVTNIKVNLWYHMRKRVMRLVRLEYAPSATTLSPEERKHRKLQMLRICDDLCSVRGKSFTCEPQYHDWVDEWKKRLRLHDLPSASMEHNVRTNANDLLYATWKVNRILEDAGKPCVSCIPVRRQMRPAFCRFDTKAIQDVLGIRADPGASMADRKRDTWGEVLHFPKSIKITKKHAFGCSMSTDGVAVRLLIVPASKALEGRSMKTRKRKHDDKAERTSSSSSEESDTLPRHGLYTIDELKRHSRALRDLPIIGADPGKAELLVCTKVHPSTSDEPQKSRRVRYTSAQRRHEMSLKRHEDLERSELPESIVANRAALSGHSSRSSHVDILAAYFACRRTHLKETLEHFGSLRYRCRAWTRFRRAQRSLSDFVNRIKHLAGNGKPPSSRVILAYGSWASVAGKAGRLENRGHPPCLGKGLRAKLAHHFIVASTPEAWTSQTCSKCGQRCEGCIEVDSRAKQRRDEIREQVDTGKLPTTTSIPHPHGYVRGLRRCVSCGTFHNRDVNAADNIGRRCAQMLFPSEEQDAQGVFPSWVSKETRRIDSELSALQVAHENPR